MVGQVGWPAPFHVARGNAEFGEAAMRGFKVGVVAVFLLAAGACTNTGAYQDAKKEVDNQDEVIRALTARNESLTAENTVLRTRAEACEAELRRLRELEDSYRRATSGVDDLEKRLREYESRSGAVDPDIELKPDWRGMKYEVTEKLLFDVGSAKLRPAGQEALRKVAERIRAGTEKIIVEGHTDNQPVKVHAKEFPLGNLELSGERALVVAHFLATQGGVDADRVSFAGFGEHQPVVPNDSTENKAKNRRVEIVVVRNQPPK